MNRINLVLVVMLISTLLCGCGRVAAPAAAPTVDVGTLPAAVDVATVKALQSQGGVLVIDVREQSEYDAGHIPNVTLIPMDQVANRLTEIPKDKPVIVTCRSGSRSGQVTDFLRQQGYTNVHNMLGGLSAWERAGYPVEK